VLGAKSDVLALLEEMLTDERLLLLVDGLDEWQNRETAGNASCGARLLSPLARDGIDAVGVIRTGPDRIFRSIYDYKRMLHFNCQRLAMHKIHKASEALMRFRPPPGANDPSL
jgi:hypothetical protein